MLPILLLTLTVAVSLYDLRTGKVPNWVTLPLLVCGMIAHFPGTLPVWLLSLVLFNAWRIRWLSAGDAKLWMAVFWVLPSKELVSTPVTFFAVFFFTGLVQILLRAFRHQPLVSVRTPGAWRTIPFMLWSLYVH